MADSAFTGSATAKTDGFPPSLAIDLVGVTEAAAVAAAGQIGRGDERRAHDLAAEAMADALSRLAVRGHVAIGEQEGSGGPLDIGGMVGHGKGPALDVALDPLEGATLTAKAMDGALSVIAVATEGGILRLPRVYMDKIAIGPGFAPGTVDLDRPPADNVRALAGAKGVSADAIVVCVLDRPRNARLIAELRQAGARIRMISDGDIAGVITTTEPEAGVDMYLGSGGAAEGVLAAAALKCAGGFFQGRLGIRNEEERRRVSDAGVDDLDRVYALDDLVKGEVLFAATGVTRGALLDGVMRRDERIDTHSLVMDSAQGVIRRLRTRRRG